MKKLISIIVPLYNEELNLTILYHDIKKTWEVLTQKYAYELIFIDDGSTDSSWACIQKIAVQDSNVQAISFARNFGKQCALKAGFDMCHGDAAIIMDSDLQHPPVAILQLIKKWEQGFDVVYATRAHRKKDGFFKRFTAQAYWFVLNTISTVKVPQAASDFCLIDRKILHILKSYQDTNPYWRGLIAWIGGTYATVECEYPQRFAGQTKYNWMQLFKLAFDGIMSFSLFPLACAAYVGLFVIAAGSAMFAYITFDAFLRGVSYPLFKWLVTITFIFIGVQFLLFWIIGEYIGRMYEQQKQLPEYVVQEKINME